ncbi:unnamed protein product [Symbiodinium sp. KB8]|nr:unnamed protein product [Symbiodinium sp. KB8]
MDILGAVTVWEHEEWNSSSKKWCPVFVEAPFASDELRQLPLPHLARCGTANPDTPDGCGPSPEQPLHALLLTSMVAAHGARKCILRPFPLLDCRAVHAPGNAPCPAPALSEWLDESTGGVLHSTPREGGSDPPPPAWYIPPSDRHAHSSAAPPDVKTGWSRSATLTTPPQLAAIGKRADREYAPDTPGGAGGAGADSARPRRASGGGGGLFSSVTRAVGKAVSRAAANVTGEVQATVRRRAWVRPACLTQAGRSALLALGVCEVPSGATQERREPLLQGLARAAHHLSRGTVPSGGVDSAEAGETRLRLAKWADAAGDGLVRLHLGAPRTVALVLHGTGAHSSSGMRRKCARFTIAVERAGCAAELPLWAGPSQQATAAASALAHAAGLDSSVAQGMASGADAVSRCTVHSSGFEGVGVAWYSGRKDLHLPPLTPSDGEDAEVTEQVANAEQQSALGLITSSKSLISLRSMLFRQGFTAATYTSPHVGGALRRHAATQLLRSWCLFMLGRPALLLGSRGALHVPCPGQVTLVGHSLGGVLAVDMSCGDSLLQGTAVAAAASTSAPQPAAQAIPGVAWSSEGVPCIPSIIPLAGTMLMGSPVSLFLTARGLSAAAVSEALSRVFRLPPALDPGVGPAQDTRPWLLNVYNSCDPVAQRLNPLLHVGAAVRQALVAEGEAQAATLARRLMDQADAGVKALEEGRAMPQGSASAGPPALPVGELDERVREAAMAMHTAARCGCGRSHPVAAAGSGTKPPGTLSVPSSEPSAAVAPPLPPRRTSAQQPHSAAALEGLHVAAGQLQGAVGGAVDVEVQPSGILARSSELYAATRAHNSYWKSRHVGAAFLVTAGAGVTQAALGVLG